MTKFSDIEAQKHELEEKLAAAKSQQAKAQMECDELKNLTASGTRTIFSKDCRIIFNGSFAKFSLFRNGFWTPWETVMAECDPSFDSEVKNNMDVSASYKLYVFNNTFCMFNPADSMDSEFENQRDMIAYYFDWDEIPFHAQLINPDNYNKWRWKKNTMMGCAIAYQEVCGKTPSYSREEQNKIVAKLQTSDGWKSQIKKDIVKYWPAELELKEAESNLKRCNREVEKLQDQFDRLNHTGKYDTSGISKKRSVALMLCIFLGWVGAHQFYMGNLLYGLIFIGLILFSIISFQFELLIVPLGLWIYNIYELATMTDDNFKLKILEKKQKSKK